MSHYPERICLSVVDYLEMRQGRRQTQGRYLGRRPAVFRNRLAHFWRCGAKASRTGRSAKDVARKTGGAVGDRSFSEATRIALTVAIPPATLGWDEPNQRSLWPLDWTARSCLCGVLSVGVQMGVTPHVEHRPVAYFVHSDQACRASDCHRTLSSEKMGTGHCGDADCDHDVSDPPPAWIGFG